MDPACSLFVSVSGLHTFSLVLGSAPALLCPGRCSDNPHLCRPPRGRTDVVGWHRWEPGPGQHPMLGWPGRGAPRGRHPHGCSRAGGVQSRWWGRVLQPDTRAGLPLRLHAAPLQAQPLRGREAGAL